MARYLKMQKLTKEKDVSIIGDIREMQKKDIPTVYKLLNEYLAKFEVKLKFSEKEVAHMLLPKNNVIYSFVVENSESKKITDFVSFYNLPSTILKKSGH